jgi:putative membrane protein
MSVAKDYDNELADHRRYPMKPEAPVWLPLLNTGLIGVSGLFLALGVAFIRQKRVVLHHRSMLVATLFAALFLVVYVSRAVLFETKLFAGEGIIRLIYFAILVSHTILAIAVGPMVLITLFRAIRGQFGRHRRLARLTAPVWAYVVVTGWIIYMMLYRLPA